ncbi:MAG TPA: YHS domain-containing (seleno)protein [Bradyrhizobium sp.]|uniref:YHS domain-containing (seleno)protein n=1 Tax=Bradyrhizobium sp. TaxID=376 RepID=UPI002D80CAC4|nr:YHS domain-containing (seleno)protein [Bradyrhizobium sp.]HET7885073.1 YHS domain-containing (seleno)protein [Bradyrhizobium sp.]
MTPERQEANDIATKPHFRPRIALIALALLAGLGGFMAAGTAARAATTERVVTNRYSGLAIEGYDPLAYFIDGRPELGLPAYEAAQGGAVWRFRNEGNRDSFAAHPEIYAPQFGGYDPVDLARGVTVAGNPRFWLVTGQRLYLFGREDTRDAFAADPAPYLKEATQRWPALEEQLAQ